MGACFSNHDFNDLNKTLPPQPSSTVSIASVRVAGLLGMLAWNTVTRHGFNGLHMDLMGCRCLQVNSDMCLLA